MRKRTKRAWAKWQQLVSEQERSGRNVSEFCHERGLCRSYFFAWKKRLREKASEKFVEVNLAEMARGELGSERDPRVEIRLPNGRSLVVGPGCDADHLRALLPIVEAA